MKYAIFNTFTTLITVTFLFPFLTFSQNEIGDWQFLKEEDGIKILTKEINCTLSDAPNSYRYLAIKIENTNSVTVKLKLNFKDYFEEGCNGCNMSEENATFITLNARSSIIGTCDGNDNKLIRFIKNPTFSGSWNYIRTDVDVVKLIN